MKVFNNLRAILTRHKENMPVVVLAEMFAEIDEAEAKWEAECCEWKLVRLGTTLITDGYRTTCGNSVKNINSGHLYCGYCGKPIKISEVE